MQLFPQLVCLGQEQGCELLQLLKKETVILLLIDSLGCSVGLLLLQPTLLQAVQHLP